MDLFPLPLDILSHGAYVYIIDEDLVLIAHWILPLDLMS